MGADDVEQPKGVEQPRGDSLAELRGEVERSVSLEAREKAEETVLDTLGLPSDDDENLDNFDEKLSEATKSLPRYQEIEEKLSGVDDQNLPYELFKLLKRDADDYSKLDPDAPKDGVLIKSMRQGHLECAGRTLIASTFLQEHGIEHVAVSAPGHAFMIIEQSPDTLAYFDANNNLFFTFPREALEGYEGTGTSAECRLKEYTPRDTDFVDGVTTVFSHFVAMPAGETIGRQYLGNVAAALNGNEEFGTSGIEVDKEACEAAHRIESEIYGENKVYENFLSRMEVRNGRGKVVRGLLMNEMKRRMEVKNGVAAILREHPDHDDFIAYFMEGLGGDMGDKLQYIKNATAEQKRAYAEKVWEYLQGGNLDENMRGR